MIKNILIIDQEPLTLRRIEIFCINELQNAGFNVHHFYISPLLGKQYKVVDSIESEIEYTIYRYDELIDKVKKFHKNETIVFVEFFYQLWSQRKILKILSSLDFIRIKFERFGNSSLLSNKSLKKKIASNLSIKNAIRVFKNRILLPYYYKLYSVKKIDYVFNSGETNKVDLQINHPDYDLYLSMVRNRIICDVQENYIVFVDTSFGKHPDEIRDNGKYVGDNYLWRKKLSNFFDKIEKRYCRKVVIAAHPKSNYDKEDWFGREIIKNKTLQLIQNSYFVIQDISSSINFCILFRKKVLLAVTSEFYYRYHLYLENLSNFLGLQIYIIDSLNIEDYQLSNINKIIYDKYRYNFLTSKASEDMLTSEILINWLVSYNS